MECSKLDTCKGSDFCWSEDCPLKAVYETVSEKAPMQSKLIYRDLLKAIASGRNIFLTAAAGCGKSYFLNQLRSALPRKITVTATTGVAALNIGGTTLHSALGLGLANKPVKEILKKLNSYKIDLLNRIEILAIDEVSMLSGELLDKCNEFLKLVRMDKRPFGGIQVILIGDFCQLPPVDTSENKKLLRDFCFNSASWKELNLAKFELVHNFRQEDDKVYAGILKKLRKGELTEEGYNLIKSRELTPPKDALRLYATNQEVFEYNTEKLQKLGNKTWTFKAKYSSPNQNIEKNDSFKQSLIDKMVKSSITEDTLTLCEGARVMLLRNLDLENGLVNGSCGYVESFTSDDTIIVEFDNGKRKSIKKEDVDMHDAEGKVLLTQKQYPLKLAYGVTSHKIQGATLDKVYIDFDRFFEVNQGYVALSRVRKLSGLYVKNFTAQKLNFSPEVLAFYGSLEQKENSTWITCTSNAVNRS